MVGQLPIGAFANQNVRVVFIWSIPENFTGPGQFTIDNVNITGVMPPIPTMSTAGLTSLALILMLMAGVFINRRAF